MLGNDDEEKERRDSMERSDSIGDFMSDAVDPGTTYGVIEDQPSLLEVRRSWGSNAQRSFRVLSMHMCCCGSCCLSV